MNSQWPWLPFNFSLPTIPLPSISLPTSLQRRFISFVLKRTLGHLLKPGQLDIDQVDSQIGNGFIEVKDIELDPQAVNNLIADLPLELHHGTFKSVTARIPWPSPLTSSLGLNISGLHLCLTLKPDPLQDVASSDSHFNLEDSVASLAKSFVDERVEDGLDPMPGDFADYQRQAGIPIEIAAEDGTIYDDPEGISIFGVLIERLLSRFELDITDIKISILHPERSNVTLNLQRIQYQTEPQPTSGGDSSTPASYYTVVRKVTVSGMSVSIDDLASKAIVATRVMDTPKQTSSPLPEASDSDSDMDEATEMMMSQSIVSLALLRPLSPALTSSSVTSSMYESALAVSCTSSEAGPRAPLEKPLPTTPYNEQFETTILSLTSEPIIVTLKTVVAPYVSPHDQKSGNPHPQGSTSLEIDIGPMATALTGAVISRLAEQLSLLTLPSKGDTSGTPTKDAPNNWIGGIQGKLNIRGVYLLLLPDPTKPSTDQQTALNDRTSLDHFFQKPTSIPHITHDYFRVHLDTLIALLPPATATALTSPPSSGVCTFRVSDLSILRIHSSATSGQPTSSPIMISDPQFAASYSDFPSHVSLCNQVSPPTKPPFLMSTDWIESHPGVGVKHWRTKAPQSTKRHSQSNQAAHTDPAINVRIDQSEKVMNCSVSTLPLHFFIDLASIQLAAEIMSDVDIPPRSPARRTHSFEDTEGSVTPRVSGLSKTIRNRGLLLDDALEGRDVSTNPASKGLISVNIPNLRIELRAQPCRGHRSRSGALIIDLHDIFLRIGGSGGLASTPAGDNLPSMEGRLRDQGSVVGRTNSTIASLTLGRIVVACSLINSAQAMLILSMSNMHDEDAVLEDLDFGSVPPFAVIVSETETMNRQKGSLVSVLIPSIYVNLTKEYFDGLQLWADDVGRWIEYMQNPPTSNDGSRDSSLIGSRFFAKRSSSGPFEPAADSEYDSTSKGGGTTIKLDVAKGLVRLSLPTVSDAEDQDSLRQLEISFSEIGALVESGSSVEGETVVTLNASNLSVAERVEMTSRHLFSTLGSSNLDTLRTPQLKIRLHSLQVPDSSAKESKIKVSLRGFLFNFVPDPDLYFRAAQFVKAPPGTFESVVPSERTKVSVAIQDSLVRISPQSQSSALLLAIEQIRFFTELVDGSPEALFKVSIRGLSVLLGDEAASSSTERVEDIMYIDRWKRLGYSLLAELTDFAVSVTHISNDNFPDTRVSVDQMTFSVHLSADTASGISSFASDMQSSFNTGKVDEPAPAIHSQVLLMGSENLLGLVDENAFRLAPEVGPAPDMVNDDLPSNPYYLDTSFGTAAGLREIHEDDLEDFDDDDDSGGGLPASEIPAVISNLAHGKETVKMFFPSIDIIDDFYSSLPAISTGEPADHKETNLRFRASNCDVRVFLYGGYDWNRTRNAIEAEVKEMRKRLARIRQLLVSGQALGTRPEELSTKLYDSIYVGLDQDAGDLEDGELIAVIDEELRREEEASLEESWQTLPPNNSGRPTTHQHDSRGLRRSKTPCIEFCLLGLSAEVDRYMPGELLNSRVLVMARNLEILDHIKTSTWSKFLTEMRADLRGNVRETESNMLRVEYLGLQPTSGEGAADEARLKAKIMPLRLYVDQDALDFLKKFFSFKDPDAPPSGPDNTFFQHVEVFPVDIKLDYKPRRVDYRALREGKTIELMNFFHFDGAEMTLRHITLKGITGWAKLGDTLNDLWTPDVKANQLVDVISGVAPIRSAINVGSGVADLVLLPIAQYKKDGRIIRGLQKGTKAFVKSTATEAVKLGARLATGTQIILEQAENILGGQGDAMMTAEALQFANSTGESDSGEEDPDQFSRYSDQPTNVKEGVQIAYRSLRKNIKSAGQTILAVPMEVYERSTSDGPSRAVVRAVPIAVLKPMIGASEAVSKALLGLRNTLDPNIILENKDKYKKR